MEIGCLVIEFIQKIQTPILNEVIPPEIKRKWVHLNFKNFLISKYIIMIIEIINISLIEKSI